MSDHFPQSWIHGAPDCETFDGPAFQVHPFDDSTFIIRQSKCVNFEGPFLYLLVGEQAAFMLDSGAAPTNSTSFPIRSIVDGILSELAMARGRGPLRLVVGHTHSHADHFAGDRALESRPDTFIIGPELESIKSAYNIADWPDGMGTLDLGGRSLTIIPTPGHEEHHICVYDSATGILLSGDILYPGKLVINDWDEYRSSAAKLAAFEREHRISFILGAHIEIRKTPGALFRIGETHQPDEHVLQLLPEHLREWAEACERIGPVPRREVHTDFVLSPA
ncbi:MAG TPA: MBL fold metallo-hydrolase [Pyrinomonadaceae bacterium]|jgi:glyoxylase-like metal-dependent hydrolase (beta-lactamase superfamily II)